MSGTVHRTTNTYFESRKTVFSLRTIKNLEMKKGKKILLYAALRYAYDMLCIVIIENILRTRML